MIHTKRKGFTIVELLVSIAVIGVLATIIIFGFSTWRSRTAVTEIKTELSSAAAAIKNYKTFNNALPANLAAIPHTPGQNVTLTYTLRADLLSYCLAAASTAATTPNWYINSSVSLTPTTTACT